MLENVLSEIMVTTCCLDPGPKRLLHRVGGSTQSRSISVHAGKNVLASRAPRTRSWRRSLTHVPRRIATCAW